MIFTSLKYRLVLVLKCMLSVSILYLPLNIFAQDLHESFRVDTSVKFITTDLLKNLYIISPRNVIMKYDSGGKLIASRQFSQYGAISSIDVSNALNAEVFFNSINKVVIIDNNLGTISEIDLNSSSIAQFGPACRASDGGFWLYDINRAKIKRLGTDMSELGESPNLASLGIKDVNPVFLIENSPWLYMSIPSSGILVFDQYGAYLKTIPLKEISRFQVDKHSIIAWQNGKLLYYDIELNEQKEVPLQLDLPDITQVRVAPHRFWVRYKKGIICYTF